ncbi:MAG: aa3-type cytochrome oxidase subunit II [Nocardioides sp.]|uniref:aa3-type cytochrome oxidase subunit II n=1 Tax=Nocardioides nematodiphilus TaxID=2849669 RepID=UPI001CD9B73D|nr:cytochrome c oxidase subunit II [Nocardioides nematodiphilus]MCA1983977.1 cytochrome c oxidase subunit II [Nocardioides nematodiphilus]
MGLQMPGSPGSKRKGMAASARRFALAAGLGASAVLLGGCSTAAKNFGMPEPATTQGEHVLNLWQGAWIAALVTGAIVWGLIFYAIWRFRRRSEDEVPVQTRYNLPLEIFYTIAPVLMVIVFFFHTVKAQDAILDDNVKVDNTVEVTGQQWTWTFNYGVGDMDAAANDNAADLKFPYSSYVYDAGTASHIPTLVLPVDETTRFNLHSPDVIHDLGVDHFNMKMDVVPGRVNHYDVTPTRKGTYRGACYELCGLYHSRMLFNVKVVSQADYQSYLEDLKAKGFTSDTPLIGGADAYTQAGLQSEGDAE